MRQGTRGIGVIMAGVFAALVGFSGRADAQTVNIAYRLDGVESITFYAATPSTNRDEASQNSGALRLSAREGAWVERPFTGWVEDLPIDAVLADAWPGGFSESVVHWQTMTLSLATVPLPVTWKVATTSHDFEAPIQDFWVIVVDPLLPIPIAIDIKPDSGANAVNLGSRGVLPVAVFTTDAFDALWLDDTTVLFGDPLRMEDPDVVAGLPLRSRVEDLDEDGRDDLLLFFSVPQLVAGGAVGPESLAVDLVGTTWDGSPVWGSDTIWIVGPEGKGRALWGKGRQRGGQK